MKKNIPDNETPDVDAERNGKYQPTAEFLQYLILAQTAQSECHETKWRKVNEQRDEVTKIIARRQARNLGDIFEKLHIWRMESFDPSDEDFIYFDDLFPLSAYYDLKKLVGIDELSTDMDDFYEDLLRCCKSITDERAEAEANNIVPLFREGND